MTATPFGDRRVRPLEADGPTVDVDAPGVVGIDATEDLHERGLAGAVLADERVHLPTLEGEDRPRAAPRRRRSSCGCRASRAAAGAPLLTAAVPGTGSTVTIGSGSVPISPRPRADTRSTFSLVTMGRSRNIVRRGDLVGLAGQLPARDLSTAGGALRIGILVDGAVDGAAVDAGLHVGRVVAHEELDRPSRPLSMAYLAAVAPSGPWSTIASSVALGVLVEPVLGDARGPWRCPSRPSAPRRSRCSGCP